MFPPVPARQKHALVLINENAGTVLRAGIGQVVELINAASKDEGTQCEFVIAGADALHARAKAVRNKKLRVLCVGGDGTQSLIAGAISGSHAALAPLPFGTVNVLCRDLGIGVTPAEAVKTAFAGEETQIDMAMIDDRVFLNNIVLGVYAQLAEAREEIREASSVAEVGAAMVHAAQTLVRSSPIAYCVRMDAELVDLESNSIIVANNAFTGAEGMVPSRSRLDEGKLFVYLTNAATGVDFARVLSAFARGASDEAQSIEKRECLTCTIASPDERFSYTVDGDPLETTEPIRVKIMPKALRVVRAAQS